MKKVNLLPEDIREKEGEEAKIKEKRPYTFKMHIPSQEKMEAQVKYRPQVRETAPKIEKQQVFVKETKPIAEKTKKETVAKKREMPMKERKVIKEKEEKKEYETKDYLGFLKKKKVEKKEEKPLGTLEVNLIPEDLLKPPTELFIIKIQSLLKISITMLVVLTLVYSALFYYTYTLQEKDKNLDAQISSLELEIAKYSGVKEDITKLQQRSQNLLSVLSGHVYWSKFFELLEKNTINDVAFSDFAAEKDSTITLTAVGKNYEAVARQLVAFQQAKDFIQSVEIKSATAQVNGDVLIGVNFTANINLVPSLLIKQDAEVGEYNQIFIKPEVAAPMTEIEPTL